MIEALIGSEFWQQILRFVLGSSILLLVVWGLELSRLVKRFETRAYLWKIAMLGSLLLLVPISVPQTPVYYLQDSSSVPAEPQVYEPGLETLSYSQPVAPAINIQAAELKTEAPFSEVVSTGTTTTEAAQNSWVQSTSAWFFGAIESLREVRLSSWLLMRKSVV